ncbi:hypothetical protein [Streptomyces syringium]|uniref:hypothetical protein n=1 Tax=Streptomyces syringium TaxID=76729 RepID=UPI003AB05059
MSTPSNNAPSANDFLMGGGGAPSAKFPAPGTSFSGPITEQPVVEQQRDFQSGNPKFWDGGEPMLQLVVTIQTDLRDPAVQDDNGKRRLYVKGQLKSAVQDAVRSSGARGLEVGGRLTVTYTHDGTASKPGFTPPKQFRAEYTPAAQAVLAAPDPAPAGVNTTTGEITAPAPAPAAGGQPDMNDPAVRALLAQLGGQGAPAQNSGTNQAPPF